MSLQIEWYDADASTPYACPKGTEIGEHNVDTEYALVFESGAAAAVVTGSFEDLLTWLYTAEEHLISLRRADVHAETGEVV